MSATAYVKAADLFTAEELRAVYSALMTETARIVGAEGVESPKMIPVREASLKVIALMQRAEQTLQLADVAA